MSELSDPRLLVIHGLRLKGFADTHAVAEATGLPVADAEPILDQIVAEGLATYRNGRLTGFALTPVGRERHQASLADQLEAAGARPGVESGYRRFLVLNPALLSICTSWQLREIDGESAVNDHTDPAYDAGVIDRLSSLHAEVEPICDHLATALERFARYGVLLATALQRVQAGDADWFTKPMVASYHTTWFEMHEDLLCTLGIERGSEGTG